MGISVTGVKPGNTTVTINSKTSPNISKKVPVTVKSRNLLSYGPASGNGLTATVNSDGSLHVTGTATGQWRGLSWTFPCPVQGTVKLSSTSSIPGLDFNVKCLNANGQQLGDQMNLGNSVMAIPAGTVSLYLNVISIEATPIARDGDLRIQLESGTTAHDWMRPDNTSLSGGCELANLYPRVTGLPKTLGTNPGITVTETTPGTYRFKGSTKTAANSWANLQSSVHLDAGTYTMDVSDFPYGPNSWNLGIQATLRPDDGGESITFGPNNYGTKTLPAGTFDTNIFVNTTGEVDKTFTPRLYKID